MIKPSQPYFVIDTLNFRQEIYLRNGISHFYTFQLDKPTDIMIVPDGCIDLLFEYRNNEMYAYACGPFLKCDMQHWNGPAEVFGIRFMPGNLPAGMYITMRELIGKRALLWDLMKDKSMIEFLQKEKDFYQRIRVFLECYTKMEKKQEPPFGKLELCQRVKDIIYRSNGLVKVQSISERTGYSERYLQKVFREYMGFSPKTFCKIVQFQKAIDVLNYGKGENMTELAVALGYYDQAKFIRDFKTYAGITPSKYIKMMHERNFAGRISTE